MLVAECLFTLFIDLILVVNFVLFGLLVVLLFVVVNC